MLKRRRWFGHTPAAGALPMPVSAPGWLTLAAFVILIACTASLEGVAAWGARLAILCVYLGLAFFMRSDDGASGAN